MWNLALKWNPRKKRYATFCLKPVGIRGHQQQMCLPDYRQSCTHHLHIAHSNGKSSRHSPSCSRSLSSIHGCQTSGPNVPVDSTLGRVAVVRFNDMPGPSTPTDSEIFGLPPLPPPLLPPPELSASKRTSDDAEVAPDAISSAVNQPRAWDIAAATAVKDRKAYEAGKSVANARGQKAVSPQLFEPMLPAPPREAAWWQATQRRHSIAAPTASKTMGGAAISHHGLYGGLGNLQRSQSIFDLPEPGLPLFAQNGSLTSPVSCVLPPPRGLELEKIRANLLLAMQRCALQDSTTPPSHFGPFNMAQHGTGGLMAVQ